MAIKESWKDKGINFIANAFNRHFWKLVLIIILIGSFLSGFSINTCKGSKYQTDMNVNPILKEIEKKK